MNPNTPSDPLKNNPDKNRPNQPRDPKREDNPSGADPKADRQMNPVSNTDDEAIDPVGTPEANQPLDEMDVERPGSQNQKQRSPEDDRLDSGRDTGDSPSQRPGGDGRQKQGR